jgi:hypothetical protein
MQFINELIKALNKKQNSNKISCVIDTGNIEFNSKENLNYPASVQALYSNINGLKISEPRAFELLRFTDLELIDGKYLYFALINENQQICFDVTSLNAAGEWDIVELENKYLITKTLASFLTNKIWAWVERSRTIWKEESYA